MSGRLLGAAAIGAAVLAWSASAAAVTCYVVMDRNDNVTYRSTVPPVDLSDQGAAARERMRQRGEYLMFGEFEQCPGITFFTGAGGSKGLALEEVVNGMPAMPMNGGVSPAQGSVSAGAVPGTRGSARAAATPPTRRPPAKRY